MLGQLPVQPLQYIHAMGLLQAGMTQQIPSEVVAIAELRVLIHLGIELLSCCCMAAAVAASGSRST